MDLFNFDPKAVFSLFIFVLILTLILIASKSSFHRLRIRISKIFYFDIKNKKSIL